MSNRKAILLLDDKEETKIAKEILLVNDIDFMEYHISKFEESCCGELPTTKAPSIIAPEGVFKGIDGIKEFVILKTGRFCFGNKQ
ncbi:MAG: hypothetical protein WCB31_04870 [Nitrososphaeraceae archaeon]